MILQPVQLEPIELGELVKYLDTHLDPESEESILSVAPYLLALGRNRRFLADYLARTITAPDFQRQNDYTSPVILLAKGSGYLVRVAAWLPADQVDTTPSGDQIRAYEDEHQTAHSHAFSLLSVGYLGSGYETDIYECDPEAIVAAGALPGLPVDLRFAGRFRLSEGTVIYYPAHRVAHMQHPPKEYSISLNVVVKSPHDEIRDQYFFDVPRGVLTGAIGYSNDTVRYLLEVARHMPDARFAPLLETIVANHPSLRVRQRAAEALTATRG
jgi:hypothetical protein